MQWGEWDSGSSCTKTCGVGKRTRKRVCYQNGHPGFDDCIGPNMKTDFCNIEPCPGTIMLIWCNVEFQVITIKLFVYRRIDKHT